jgi:hypothetical protein
MANPSPDQSEKPRRRRFLRAVGYIVVGSEAERARAEQEIVGYCQIAGLDLEEVVADSRESVHRQNFGERPGGAKVIRSFTSRVVRHLVLRRLHDAFPTTEDFGAVAGKLRRRRRHIHILNFAGKPFTTEDDRVQAFWRLAEALGRIEGWNTRDRLARKEESGEVAGWVRGAVPYGYDRRGTLLIQNEREQAVIQQITEMQARGLSLHRIAKVLNDAGIPAKKGGKWYAASVFGAASRVHRQFSVSDTLWRPDDALRLRAHIQEAEELGRMESTKYRKGA